MNAPKPFREDDAPGRIPDSLIDAVLDGAVDDQTRREVNRALRHDASRQRDVAETMEAIRALRDPIDCPDLSADVLAALDRKHRFLPARAHRAVRQARLGIGLAALLALGTVAVTQRAMPRLASLGTPETPISDVARAIHADADEAAGGVRDSARLVRASVPLIPTPRQGARAIAPLAAGVPGNRSGHQYRFEIDRGDLGGSLGGHDLSGYRMVTIEGGGLLLIESHDKAHAHFVSDRRGTVSLVTASFGWQIEASPTEEPDSSETDGASESRGGWVAEELP